MLDERWIFQSFNYSKQLVEKHKMQLLTTESRSGAESSTVAVIHDRDDHGARYRAASGRVCPIVAPSEAVRTLLSRCT